jgi:Polysaccharide deacetylase
VGGIRHALVAVATASALVWASTAAAAAAPARIPVVAYHGVTTETAVASDPNDDLFYHVRLSELRAQLAYLKAAGYRSITPDQYRRWVYGLRQRILLPPKPILITFDDGQTSSMLATRPLRRYGFRAVMYVVSGFAGGSDSWFLTWNQLEAMRASGWMFQFHAGPLGHGSIQDPSFPDCVRFYPCRFGENDETYRARVRSDVTQGLAAMRTAFGLGPTWRGASFAVPWDDWGQPATTNEPWLVGYFSRLWPVVFVQGSYPGRNANHLRYRFEVHNPDGLSAFTAGLSSSRFSRLG